MKRFLSKFAAVALSLTVICSMSAVSFADEPATGGDQGTKTYQDGFYTTTVSTDKGNKDIFGWKTKTDGSIQEGYSYPSNNYDLPVTIQIKDGKIVDVAYTYDIDTVNVNNASDFNYLTWAMSGHEVTDYTYEYYCGNYEDYHLEQYPAKNGVGMKDQIIAKNGTEGVDTVTAATITSEAIIRSVNASLEKAEKGEKDDPEPVLPKEDDTEVTVPSDGVYFGTDTPDCNGATFMDGTTIIRVNEGKIYAQIGIAQRRTSFPYLFPGTEKEAIAAGESGWFYPVDIEYGAKNPGVIYKELPFKSVDKMIPLVIKTKSSGNWFNRRMKINTADLKQITEGYYEPEFQWSGGSGRLELKCPRVKLSRDGEITADIVFTSTNITKAVVDGVEYQPQVDKKAGTSTFTVPVYLTDSTYPDLQKDMVITATTVAMSSPTDIDYTFSVKVDPENLKLVEKIKTPEEKAAEEAAAKEAAAKKAKIAAQKKAAQKMTVKGLKVTSKSKKATVTFKKTKGATAYQIQYKLKSAKKWSNLAKSTKKAKVTSKKLKKGKKYSFRVRTITKVNGKNIYGKWTKAKTIKIK